MMNNTNATADLIIKRLPTTPLVSSDDIAAAIGAKSTKSVLLAIACGHLAVCRVSGRYIIARSEAVRWIRASAVVPDEG